MANIESLSGTTIPGTTAIFDDRQAKWTILGGRVYRNGIGTLSSGVTLLFYLDHVVYHKNSLGNWWKWDNNITVGNSWKATPNPTPRPTPAPSLPVGESRVDFYMDDELVNSTKLVPDGS